MKGIVSDVIRLQHILVSINFIETFSAGKVKEDIFQNFMYRFSIERQLEIIGEAANNLSPSLIKENADGPWPQIISFRNFIVHGYFGLDLEMIWDIIITHIPPFKIQIEKILNELNSGK